MSEIKKIGIIGCGAVVQRNYFQILPRLAGISVDYVYDPNKESAKTVAKFFNAKIISADEMLKYIDFALIASPPQTHFDLAKKAITKKVNVICEKPFVITVNEAEELHKISQEYNVILAIPHFRRLYPSVQMTRKIIKSGLIGTLKSIDIIEGGRFSWDTKSDYILSNKYGGVLLDTGSHTVDLALFAADLDSTRSPIKIQTVIKDKEEPSHEIAADFCIDRNNENIKFRLQLSRYDLLANKIKIIGDKGTIELSVTMQSKLRLSGPEGSTIVFADRKYKNGIDCITELYDRIFSGKEADLFMSERFINLTSILENILNFREDK